MRFTLPTPASLTPPDRAPTAWSYDEAFCRHRGLIDEREQQRLRHGRVAIAGLGGVGGVHLTTLARLGIGAFHIADPDAFELANFNRQHGAGTDTLGRGKAAVLAGQLRGINPEVELRVFAEGVTPGNVAAFLDGADVYIDGVDFFALDTRRMLFREARRRGIWAVTAAPLGFSTAWLLFDPRGMSFDDYFALHDGQDRLEQLIAFALGLAPAATHLQYLDLAQVDLTAGRGPSAGLACELCAGVTAAAVVKLLLGRGPVHPAPWYCQFDAYRHLFRRGYMRGVNRHPWQRLKHWWLRRRLRRMGVEQTRGMLTAQGLPPRGWERYMNLAILARGVHKNFGAGARRVPVLRGAGMGVARGETVFLVGPSGSGKTTLLSILGCLLTPDEGSVQVLGEEITGRGPAELTAFRRRHLGFIFQSFNLFPTLSALDNIRLALTMRELDLPCATERAEQLLGEVGLADRAHLRPAQLSTGECQRVAVARALAADPALLLADEPTASLDAENGQRVLHLLTRLVRQHGVTLVVVTHDERIFPFADRILRLEDGRLTHGWQPRPRYPLRESCV